VGEQEQGSAMGVARSGSGWAVTARAAAAARVSWRDFMILFDDV